MKVVSKKLLVCPVCNTEMVEMKDGKVYYTVCSNCGALLSPNDRINPYRHISQAECTIENMYKRPYDYFNETMNI